MSVIRKLAATASLVGLTLVSLGVHGCPVLDGDPELEPGEYPLAIAAILEGGLRILVEIAQPAITPQRIQVGLPVPFSSFGQEQIGALIINEDLVGAFERKFNILRTDETRFYIDFNNSGTFDSNEIRGGPHRLDHLAAFLRWTPQFLLPPVREILRGGEPEGKVPLRMFFQASVHLLRRRPSVRRVRSLAVV